MVISLRSTGRVSMTFHENESWFSKKSTRMGGSKGDSSFRRKRQALETQDRLKPLILRKLFKSNEGNYGYIPLDVYRPRKFIVAYCVYGKHELLMNG